MSKSNFRSLLNTTPVQSLPIDQCRHNINPFAIPDICSDTHLNPPTLKPKCLRTKSPPELRSSPLTSQSCHSLNYSQLWALTSFSNTYLKLRFTLLTWTQCYQATKKKGTFLQVPGQKKLLSSHCSFCLFVFCLYHLHFQFLSISKKTISLQLKILSFLQAHPLRKFLTPLAHSQRCTAQQGSPGPALL